MKGVKRAVLGLYLLTAFASTQGAALASYSNDEGSYSKKEEMAEGSHSDHHQSDVEVLTQAASELKSSNPELSAKVEKLAEKFRS